MADVIRHDEWVHEVWSSIQRDAHALAAKDPFLASIVKKVILGARTFQAALALRLSVALAQVECPEDQYLKMFTSVLDRHPSIVSETAQDLVAAFERDPTCPTHLHAFLNFKGFLALQVHRLSHRLWIEDRRELAFWLSNHASVVLGADIHPAARFGVGCLLDHGSGIVIGETAVVEDAVTILQNVTLGSTGKAQGDRHPKIRKGAMIGAGANVIGNVEIGAWSKIGAGSVVLNSVPAGCTAVGVPARILRRASVHTKYARSLDADPRPETRPSSTT